MDHTLDDQSVFESGAIMLHVAEKYSESGLLPKVCRQLSLTDLRKQQSLRIQSSSDLWIVQDPKQKAEVISWLMFQMGGVGPMQACRLSLRLILAFWQCTCTCTWYALLCHDCRSGRCMAS